MKIAMILFSLALLPTVLMAETIEYTSNVPLQCTCWDETLQLQKFDSNLGTLLSVEVLLDAGFEGSFKFENMDDLPGSYYAERDWVMTLMLPDDMPLVLFDEMIICEGDLEAYDGVYDFDGPSGDTIPISADMEPMVLFGNEELDFFIGTDTIDMAINAFGEARITLTYGAGGWGTTSSAFAELIVLYEYDANVATRDSSWSALKSLY